MAKQILAMIMVMLLLVFLINVSSCKTLLLKLKGGLKEDGTEIGGEIEIGIGRTSNGDLTRDVTGDPSTDI